MQTELEVLYEDNHIIIVNKPNNELVQKDKTGDTCLLERVKQYIKEKYEKPGEVYLGLPHRLDRPVSGVMLFARTSKALSRLNNMFKEKQIDKTYWAIVKDTPQQPSDTLIHYLIKNTKLNKSFAREHMKEGHKKAVLSYQLIGSATNYHLLEISLMTGRHHQIRVQLSSMGCPIKGDLKYGYKQPNPDGGICLHARKISFLHPVKKEPITIYAPVPNDKLWKAFEELAGK